MRPAFPATELEPFQNVSCPEEPFPCGTTLGRLDALRLVIEFPSPENFVAANVLDPAFQFRAAFPVIALPPFQSISCPDEPDPCGTLPGRLDPLRLVMRLPSPASFVAVSVFVPELNVSVELPPTVFVPFQNASWPEVPDPVVTDEGSDALGMVPVSSDAFSDVRPLPEPTNFAADSVCVDPFQPRFGSTPTELGPVHMARLPAVPVPRGTLVGNTAVGSVPYLIFEANCVLKS